MSYGNPTCIRVIADATGLPSLTQFWIPCCHQLHDLLFVSCTQHGESSQGEEKQKKRNNKMLYFNKNYTLHRDEDEKAEKMQLL
jgi:hypothetical protein